MPFVRWKKFLGLPLVAGVCILASLGVIVGGAGAVGGWVHVIDVVGKHPIPIEDQVGVFVFAITFSLLALLSLLGLIGGLVRSYNIIIFYKNLVRGHLLLIIAALGLSLFSTIHPVDNSTIERCLGDSPDYLVKQFCVKGISLMKGLRIGISALAAINQICAWIIANNFADKLDLDSVMRRTIIFPDGKASGNGYRV
ncbi:hypothetical protein E1B28_009018 [Marasmius oreades]|uniref:Uncharacterized protein n=1 Tax=Marasmius oreades TaxID=181124 RepID=A0A9P7RZR5_9AGAR|nr:uncharacterized protein E1B28_009018 [Marasmius oreades]KAG7092685.1 hypothetical protein E1B28_009018 [Marasmius oreades]